MTIGLLLLVLIGIGASLLPWQDLLWDADIDGEKRPVADEIQQPDIQPRQPEKTAEPVIHYTHISNQAFRVLDDMEWESVKGNPEVKPKVSTELIPEEIAAMHEYNDNAGKKARIKLNETDFAKLKACFLLGLSAPKTQEVHKTINLRLIKGYLAVYNTIHNPKKATARGATNPSPRTVSHSPRTKKRAKKASANH